MSCPPDYASFCHRETPFGYTDGGMLVTRIHHTKSGLDLTLGNVKAAYTVVDTKAPELVEPTCVRRKTSDTWLESLRRFGAWLFSSCNADQRGSCSTAAAEQYLMEFTVEPFELKPQGISLKIASFRGAVLNPSGISPPEHKPWELSMQFVPISHNEAQPISCAGRTYLGKGYKKDIYGCYLGGTKYSFEGTYKYPRFSRRKLRVKDFGWTYKPAQDWSTTLAAFRLVAKMRILSRSCPDPRTARYLTLTVSVKDSSFLPKTLTDPMQTSSSARDDSRALQMSVSPSGELRVALRIDSASIDQSCSWVSPVEDVSRSSSRSDF